MDYETLAKQFGGTTGSAPATDYETLAKQFGGTTQTAPPEPTTWQKVRPYVAPALETAGAVAGGLVGFPAGGPVGSVVGGGLGYGASKEALNLMDTYLGNTPTATPVNAMARAGGNVLEGAALDAAGGVMARPIMHLAGRGGQLLGGIANMMPTNKAAAIVRQAAGVKRPEVGSALRSGSPDVLPAQTLEPVAQLEMQALHALATRKAPTPYSDELKRQGAQTLAELEAMAGGATQTETRATQESIKKGVNQTLGPDREAALAAANIAGELKPGLDAKAAGLEDAAANAVDKVRRFIPAGERATEKSFSQLLPTGMRMGSAGKYTFLGEAEGLFDKWATRAADASLDLGAGARFARAASDSLAAHGLKPLESKPVVEGIKRLASDVEYAGNKPMRAAFNQVADDIAEFTSKGGVIDARALDAIRKNSVNAAIQSNLGTATPKVQQEAAAKIIGKIKPLIDDAIEAAGGTGYKAYLETYAAEMQALSQVKLAGKMLDLYKNRPNQFVKMVNGDDQKAVEKILGNGRYNIEMELPQAVTDTLKRAAGNIERNKSVIEQGEKGREALAEIIRQNTVGIRLPWLSKTSTGANAALENLENRVSAKTMATLVEAFKTHKGVGDLLDKLPAADRTALRRALADTSSWLPPTVKGFTVRSYNAMRSDDDSQNRFAQ